LPYKLDFCDAILTHCRSEVTAGQDIVLCGDYNIAHQSLDLANPKANEGNAGYLPEERAWMTRFLSQGFRDPFRERHADNGHYTWWSYRSGVREKNIGWRIDYHCINDALADRVQTVAHLPHILGSDHCPILLELR
jgi:exodeoxyribonuclease-3